MATRKSTPSRAKKPAITTLKTCRNGHRYHRSSDCPVCPKCEMQQRPTEGFLSVLSAPARRALLSQGIDSPEKLAQHTEKQVLALHGMGKASLPLLKQALKSAGLGFRP